MGDLGRLRVSGFVFPAYLRRVLSPTVQLASLCFVVRDGKILLIRKKRGIGAGKINGPGGKVDPGETMLESAVRETREEIGVTPLALEQLGLLHFDFLGGIPVECGVFRAADFTGELIETDEAIPLWAPLEAVPYGEMWDDDRDWMPLFLAGKRFRGWVRIAPGEHVHDVRVVEVSADEML